jgi:hypothetical protein
MPVIRVLDTTPPAYKVATLIRKFETASGKPNYECIGCTQYLKATTSDDGTAVEFQRSSSTSDIGNN